MDTSAPPSLCPGKEEQFHTIDIRIRTPGLHVRTHHGFLNSSGRDHETPARVRDGELMRALKSPFAAGDIRLRLTPSFGNSPEGTYLQAMLFMEPADLKFVETEDGAYQAVVNLAAMTFDSDGRVADAVDRNYLVRLPAPLYQSPEKLGLLYSLSLPVKRPGVFQMRAAVRDATSGRLGSANEFIEVPDLSKGWLALSSIALREQVSKNHPAPGEGTDGPITEANAKGSDAVRVFKPGSSILYHYQIYNARADSNNHVALESQTRLLRDGVEIYADHFTALEVHGKIDPKRLSTGGNLKLNEKLAHGAYTLQILVQDKLAKKDHQVTSQWIDFELR